MGLDYGRYRYSGRAFLTNVSAYFRQKELEEAFSRAKAKVVTVKAPPSSGAPEPEVTGGVVEEAVPKMGDPLGMILVPKIGLKTIFVEGTSQALLKGAPGHIAATALPGRPGNAVISGHRTTYGAFFYRLDELAAGDKIEIVLADERFVFTVSGHEIVWPNNTEVLEPTPDPTLTLTTCFPKYSAKQRLIVKATLDKPI
ncbi:MAG: class E sortase [Terriglobia bacterium]